MGKQDHLLLTPCDREPIHIPGSIQPHGLVLVADTRSRRVVAGAGALEDRLAARWLGEPLEALLGQEVFKKLDTLGQPVMGQVLEKRVSGSSETFDAILHSAGDRLIIELDPVNPEPWEAMRLLSQLDGFARTFERAGDLVALCRRAAVAFRKLTGFDRVMIYRFIDDEAGQVIAEDSNPSLASFLHHHFPGSDIPRQARALYVRNRARSICTVDYTPMPLRPAGFEELDLSDVGLRSVSPVHLQYLRNMGVAASASFSIVRDGVLWGLVACHHNSPRRLPRDVMIAGTALGGALSRQIQAREQARAYDERLRLRAAVDEVAPAFSRPQNETEIFRDLGHTLCRLLDADGFAFVNDETVQLSGIGPEPQTIMDLTNWGLSVSPAEPLVTRRLSERYEPARGWPERASGLLLLPLPDQGKALLWFRVDEAEQVRWAGIPHKPTEGDARALTPRASFATWVETVRGRSRAWTLEDVDAASRLGRVFTEARINLRMRRLNKDLQKSLAERDGLLEQKDMLMREIDHRVQNSLQIIGAYLVLKAREAGPGPVADHLTEAKARLSAVAHVHGRLYRSDHPETVDLGQYLGALTADLRQALGDEWRNCISADFAPLLLPSSSAMSVGLIMTELVINATKYAYAGQPGPIDIKLQRHRGNLRLSVADEGAGLSATPRSSSGFGSRMISATVGGLNGKIEYEDATRGLKAILTAPTLV